MMAAIIGGMADGCVSFPETWPSPAKPPAACSSPSCESPARPTISPEGFPNRPPARSAERPACSAGVPFTTLMALQTPRSYTGTPPHAHKELEEVPWPRDENNTSPNNSGSISDPHAMAIARQYRAPNPGRRPAADVPLLPGERVRADRRQGRNLLGLRMSLRKEPMLLTPKPLLQRLLVVRFLGEGGGRSELIRSNARTLGPPRAGRRTKSTDGRAARRAGPRSETRNGRRFLRQEERRGPAVQARGQKHNRGAADNGIGGEQRNSARPRFDRDGDANGADRPEIHGRVGEVGGKTPISTPPRSWARSGSAAPPARRRPGGRCGPRICC